MVGCAGCSMPSYDRALHALRSWSDSWSGIGHVAVGMARQGYDLRLTRYDEKLAGHVLHDRDGAFSDQARPVRDGSSRRGTRSSGRRRGELECHAKVSPSDQSTTARTSRLRPSSLNRSAAGGSRGREFSFSNSSEQERVRSSSRDEPTGRSRSSPWARRRRRYGSETVTLSPDAEMLNVPNAVSEAYV